MSRNFKVKSDEPIEGKLETPEVPKTEEPVKLSKAEQTEKVRQNMLSILNLDEDSFKNAILYQFKNNRVILSVATQAVENLTAKTLTELRDAVEGVMVMGAKPTYVRDETGKIISVEFHNELTDEMLIHYVTYLPGLTFQLTQKIQNKALDSEITSYLAELSLKEKFLSVGEGTIQEKNSAAEMLNVTPKITALIQKRVYSCMKEEVEAANRLYEGLKKVLQHRIEEKRIFTGSSNLTP